MTYRVIQITDCHLMEKSSILYRERPVFEQLRKIIADAVNKKPDVLLLTGDLAQQETQSAYQQLTELLKNWTIPIYWIPGNHDDLSLMQTVFANTFKSKKYFILGKWQIILLSSKLPYDTGAGSLNVEQLDFLQQRLNREPNKFALVVLHHHVLPITGLMDKYPLKNAKELLKVLENYPNIKLVISGHVHQEFDQTYKDIRFLTTPSTSYQITPGKEILVVDSLAPGYRIIDLLSDGKFSTQVVRVK